MPLKKHVTRSMFAILVAACSGGTTSSEFGNADGGEESTTVRPRSPPSDAATDATRATDGGGADSAAPGECSKLALCCPKLDPSWREACERDVSNQDEANCAFTNWYYSKYCGG